MTTTDPPEQQPSAPEEALPPPSSAVERANRMSAANMLRSLAPLVVICLAVVGWLAFLREDTDPVREVDASGTIQRAAEYAAYPLEAPAGLPDGFRPTDTDFAGAPGEQITLGIDYVTPAEDYARFVTSDDPEAAAVDAVLADADPDGTTDIGGREWTRSTTASGEIALTVETGGATVLVTGDASDEELEIARRVDPARRGLRLASRHELVTLRCAAPRDGWDERDSRRPWPRQDPQGLVSVRRPA